jgi:hypothetical protein
MEPGDDDPRLGAALGYLARASYGMAPDHLAADVATAGSLLGGDVTLLVVDLDQQRLRPLDPEVGDPAEYDVDEPRGAGEAFRLERVVEERSGDGRRRLWVPSKDSAERVGVLAVVDDGTVPPSSWEAVASLAGELVVSKAPYGDTITLRRRLGPMSLAAEMRWALLPPLTYTSPDLHVSGIVRPSYGVAGDAFDYGVQDRTASFAILDAMGHGLEASRMANVAISSVRNSRRNGLSSADSLLAMDEVITSEFGDFRFVTAQVATLDLDSGEAVLANAGHPPPLLLRADGTCDLLDVAGSRPAGLGLQHPPTTTTTLEPGDALLFHTDGVADARSPSGDAFGEHRLAEVVSELVAEELPPAEVLRVALRRVTVHQGSRGGDDATLLLARWTGPRGDGS